MRAMKTIPSASLILHVDSTGSLVTVNNSKSIKYKRIMNYAIIAKNAKELDKRGLLVNETITSGNDTFALEQMFGKFQQSYYKLFNNDKMFSLLVCDLSWATIHASLHVFNRENIHQYAERVFQLAQDKNNETDSNKIYTASCNSHSMKRFCFQVKKNCKFTSLEIKRFAICSFTLLANCRDLNSFDAILKLIYLVFLSNKQSDVFQRAKRALEALIEQRPIDDCIEKIVRDNLNANFIHEEKSSENLAETQLEIEDDEKFNDKNKTIKNKSPFTHHFKEIFEQTKPHCNAGIDDFQETNTFYNLSFIELLNERFLPYAFIWSGFVFKTLKTDDANQLTRLTNGAVESFFNFRKNLVSTPLQPAIYIKKTIGNALAQIKFTKNQKVNKDCEEESDEDKEEDEQPAEKAQDFWQKKKRTKKVCTKYVGFYQKPQTFKFDSDAKRSEVVNVATVLNNFDLNEFYKPAVISNDLTKTDDCNYNLFDLNQIHDNIMDDIQSFDDNQDAPSSDLVAKSILVPKSSNIILPSNKKQRKRNKMIFFSPHSHEEIEISQIVINNLLDCDRMISSEVFLVSNFFFNLNLSYLNYFSYLI
jgi:hypothetical protein